jgi:phosphoribosylformimino-5-aminoimidazole carboxamide ribotide isomerase
MMLTVIPAIDLKNGRCVRLRQGDASRETVYSDDPVEVARRWAAEGAARIHVVDLDGAFQGRPVHATVVADIVRAVSARVQVGGGLRTDDDMEAMLDAGVDRVVVGTRVLSAPRDIDRMVNRFGARVAVGVDARNGFVQVNGWVNTTERKAVDVARMADAAGVRAIVFTDTTRDGMLGGVNVDAMAAMCDAVKCGVIASGGVASADDVAALARLRRPNLEGVIVGKALYEGRVAFAALAGAAGEGKEPQ